MKEKYEKPQIDFIIFDVQDVIVTSGGEIDNELPDEENPFDN